MHFFLIINNYEKFFLNGDKSFRPFVYYWYALSSLPQKALLETINRAVCVKWDSGVKAAVILTTIMLDDSKRQCLFSLEYYLVYT